MYLLVQICLLFVCRARRVSLGPGKWGCVRVQEGVARVRRRGSRPALCPALAAYFVPNHSHFGSPGSDPGRRRGCTGDILYTGFEQRACLVLSSFSQRPTLLVSYCGQDQISTFKSLSIGRRPLPVQALTLLPKFLSHVFFSGVEVSPCSSSWPETHDVA